MQDQQDTKQQRAMQLPQNDNQQASVTLDNISDLYSFCAEEGNITRLYESLSDREASVGELLQAVRSQRQLPPHDDVELFITLRNWKPVLREIPSWALSECFTRAVGSHNADNPFQAGEVVTIWRKMSETTKANLYGKRTQKALPPGPPCGWCAGSGFMRIRDDLVGVKFNSPEETNRVVFCDCRRKNA